MKCTLILIGLAGLLAGDVGASPLTDSLVSFIGANAKFIWRRVVVCNDAYQPLTTPITRLMLLDTREGRERVLTEGNTIEAMRISRSGKWATFVDDSRTYIIDLSAPTPAKKVFLDKTNCSYWLVGAHWCDPVNGAEYVFCLDNFGVKSQYHGDGIYKVPLKADGTADVAKAVKLTIDWSNAGSGWGGVKGTIDGSISVSADGKKLGGAFPWPETYILDIPTGRLDYCHVYGFGCQPNLAPDNSYRFYHCEGEHAGIYMFEANMVNQSWFVDLSKNLDGFPAAKGMDFLAPRWTNNVRFVTYCYPMGDIYNAYTRETYAGKTADWVKTNIRIESLPKFVLGKFSADFKSQEKSKIIACDIRYLQYYGDGWLENGVITGSTAIASTTQAQGIVLGGGPVLLRQGANLSMQAQGPAVVQLTDARGRTVLSRSVRHAGTVELSSLPTGIYAAAISARGERLTQRCTIGK